MKQLPAQWGALCKKKDTSYFAWAHKGTSPGSAWVQLKPDGELETKWGKGKWEISEGKESGRLELCFGAVRHVCFLREGDKFEVVERLKTSTGELLKNPTEKGVEVLTAGWPIEGIPEASRSPKPDSKGKKRKEVDGDGSSSKRQKTGSAKKPSMFEPGSEASPDALNVFLVLAQAKTNKDRRVHSVMNAVKAKFHDLSDDDRALYKSRFKALSTDYKAALRITKEAAQSGEDKEQKEEGGVVLPKKPVGGAFAVFISEKRPEIMKTEKKITKVMTVGKEMWEKLGSKGQKPYQEKYAAKKKEYDDAMQQQKAAVHGA